MNVWNSGIAIGWVEFTQTLPENGDVGFLSVRPEGWSRAVKRVAAAGPIRWAWAAPVVVTITRTDGRARLLQRTAQTILSTAPDADRLRTQTEFDFAALHDFLGPAGPSGAIWRVAGRDGLHPLIPLSSVSEDSSGSARKERVPTSRTDGQRCVYVIELDDVEQPRTTPLPCVYVGQSAQRAEVRFAQHKAGYKSSRFARRFGKHLRPDLSEHVKCTADWQTALGREAALAAELRRAGHCVHGGH